MVHFFIEAESDQMGPLLYLLGFVVSLDVIFIKHLNGSFLCLSQVINTFSKDNLFYRIHPFF